VDWVWHWLNFTSTGWWDGEGGWAWNSMFAGLKALSQVIALAFPYAIGVTVAFIVLSLVRSFVRRWGNLL
jgi:hypothetical protein